MNRTKTRGYGLMELLLVVGASAVAMAAVYGLYKVVAENNRQDNTVQWVEATVVKVTEAFASASNYQALSQDRAIEEGLFGKEAQVEEGRVIGPWGGEAQLIPRSAQIQGQTVDYAAFSLVLNDVPSNLCAPLVSSLASSQAELTVNQQPVGTGKELDIGRSGEFCAQPLSQISLTFVRSDASSGLRMCTPPTEPQEQTVNCGEGLAGTRLERREGHCAGSYGEPTWSAWAVVEDNCAPCPGPETQTAACPPGEFGQVYQRRSFNCPENQWGEWETLNASCQPCLEDEFQTVACPAGQVGEIRQRRTFYCTSQTWGSWMTVSSTCS